MSTENDRLVLNSILNPNLPLGEGVFDPAADLQPSDDDNFHGVVDSTESVPEEVKQLENFGLEAAEKGEVEVAVQAFTKAIDLHPDIASCYNNRAQALRMIGNTDAALEDVEKAIRLSGGVGKVAASALCQRALLQRKEGHDDAALSDFSAAAKLGSGFAQSMLVEMNPYAAMCNAMLRNVFTAMANPVHDEQRGDDKSTKASG